MSQNLISTTMTNAQQTSLLGAFTTFDTAWTPFLCTLSPEQISRLSRMSPDDIALLDLALTWANQNSSALPGDLGLAEFSNDVALAKQIVPVDLKAQQTADKTHCTLVAVLSDAYVVAREIYRIAKARGRNPGNAEFLDRFGARFKGAGGNTAAPAKQPS